jgi:hypothetical protein
MIRLSTTGLHYIMSVVCDLVYLQTWAMAPPCSDDSAGHCCSPTQPCSLARQRPASCSRWSSLSGVPDSAVAFQHVTPLDGQSPSLHASRPVLGHGSAWSRCGSAVSACIGVVTELLVASCRCHWLTGAAWSEFWGFNFKTGRGS